MKIQSKLCPEGKSSKENRPGSLAPNGICIRDKEGRTPVSEILEKVRIALNGGLTTVEGNHEKTGNIVTAQVNYAAPLLNPIKDLRTIKPASFSKCNGVTSFSDSTIGGIFPNGDANSFLQITGNLTEECWNDYYTYDDYNSEDNY